MRTSPNNKATEKIGKNRSESSDFLKPEPAQLLLADGTRFAGNSPLWQPDSSSGEVVFNTGMTGYVESLTDPSYANQILVFTFPLIGNYGVNLAWSESDKVQVGGVVVSEAVEHWSHTQSDRSLLAWLRSQDIPILIGADTRAITKHLRTHGTMAGTFGRLPEKPPRIVQKFVSIDEPIDYHPKRQKTVIVVDCGSKANILRKLEALQVHVRRVPYDYDYSSEKFDGVLLSNGPGDPAAYTQTIAIARRALAANKPVFGICLGSQIIALAAGAKTYKLKFGHRGHNQPCLEVATGRCFITSQNHGYAIDKKTLPKGWQVSFENLNDQSVEGIAHATKPFFAVQFHPEACPGPTDTAWLFEKFRELL